MRVVSGIYKGRVLKGYDLVGTRPTMDRVKESLFAMLQPYLKNSVCLDLFAGSGNLGIEALSQGARSVVFVDRSKLAIQTIKENLHLLQVKEETLVLRGDFLEVLKTLSHSFDLIFLDPPYQSDYIEKSLVVIHQCSLLKEGGIVVLESDKEEKMRYDEGVYEKIKERQYGDKLVRLLRKRS